LESINNVHEGAALAICGYSNGAEKLHRGRAEKKFWLHVNKAQSLIAVKTFSKQSDHLCTIRQ
jgi:hypothetical protein